MKSDTIFRLFERDTSSDEDAMVLPGYEYLQVDVGQLSDYGLSFHLYGWGRNDFAENDYYLDQTSGELLYGYLEYSLETSRFNARLGRQYVFAGVANDAIDGLRLGSDLGDYFSFSAYAGQPVALDSEQGRSGDSIFGGRLAHHYDRLYDIGVSYKAIDNDDETAEKKFGVDLALFLPADISLYGFSAYNDETTGWAEHSYEVRIPFGAWLLKPFFQKFIYEDYFGTGANAVNPFRVLAQTDEELQAYGLDALYRIKEAWTLGGKVKEFDYSVRDKAQYYSLSLSWQSDDLTQFGGELGYTSADDTAGTDYTLVRLYGYCEEMAASLGIDFVGADLLLAFYDEAIYGEDSSVFASLSGGKRFWEDALTVTLSGDYSQDPYFDDDLRGMLSISYRYDQE